MVSIWAGRPAFGQGLRWISRGIGIPWNMSTRSILLVLSFLVAACGPAPDPDEGRGDIAEKELQKQDVTADLTAIDNVARPVPLDPAPVDTPEPTAPLPILEPTPEPTADPVEAWVSPDPSTGYALPYPELCGNGELDPGEECDGDLFVEDDPRECRRYMHHLPQGGQNFVDGDAIGNLQCEAGCRVNTNECTAEPDLCLAMSWDDDQQTYVYGPLVLDGSDPETVEEWADCPAIAATHVVFANFDDGSIAPFIGSGFLDGVAYTADGITGPLWTYTYDDPDYAPISLNNVTLSSLDFLANVGVMLDGANMAVVNGDYTQQIELVNGSTVTDYTALCGAEYAYGRNAGLSGQLWALVLDWTDGAPAHSELCD